MFVHSPNIFFYSVYWEHGHVQGHMLKYYQKIQKKNLLIVSYMVMLILTSSSPRTPMIDKTAYGPQHTRKTVTMVRT